MYYYFVPPLGLITLYIHPCVGGERKAESDDDHIGPVCTVYQALWGKQMLFCKIKEIERESERDREREIETERERETGRER